MKTILHLVLWLNIVPSHACLSVSPSRSQLFEYEAVSLSCEISSGEWRVRRFTTDSLKLSWCGEDWGSVDASHCTLNTAKCSDSGLYWCEFGQGESSNTVNITVTDGAVILESPVLPVMEGGAVTLRCTTKTTPSNLPADFYKDGVLIRTELTGQMTIHNVSKSDEGLYKCNISGHGESPGSWLVMEAVSPRASLTVTPNASQLFEYDRLSLSCEKISSDGWRVRRSRLPDERPSSCGEGWGSPRDSGCTLHTAKASDTATYWCESATGQHSNSASITVHAGAVILESPVLPVMEGGAVTLRCTTKTTPSNLTADFYKDGSLIRTESTGQTTIHSVSKSDEGLYKCNISGHGESPGSWLFVRAPLTTTAPTTATALPTPPAPLLHLDRLVCHLVVICPYCISTLLMLSIYCTRPGRNDPTVSMDMAPPSQADDGLDEAYDDVIADMTTEHHF